ncbi:MBL fold metallo-hydrolase [Methylobrevis pamukkalensis]|uniref:Ribonuclease Z n=1 Tax=Methylobrevis pamukkalensis TaxID=1439726 RepID=A0A1E3H0D7_9HYPH|nr:MBL fold metallo-hydrolase [Methylobrevis pamukkalensis]ODN69041.1 ribonuclease Z [Methylobrevis pamukkalensis]
MQQAVTVTFWGVRGSVPVAGADHVLHGGDTTCVELRSGSDVVVIDLGTGARALGKALDAATCPAVTVLFSHAHYDHVLGVPFFRPLYRRGTAVTLASALAGGTAAMVADLMRVPFFPVGPTAFLADVTCVDLDPSAAWTTGDGLRIAMAPTCHPGGAHAFRIDTPGGALACIFDHAAGETAVDEVLVAFAAGVDLVVLDAGGAALGGETASNGHSGWRQALALGLATGARSVALTHHHPDCTDGILAAREADVTRTAPHAFLARCGDRVTLGQGGPVRMDAGSAVV